MYVPTCVDLTLPRHTLTRCRSRQDLLGGEELPDAGEDITFSNISMTSFSAELAVDRRKTSVLERMSSAVTADSERGRRRRTINGSTDEAENASAVGNILPPSLVGKPSILQESGKTNFPVEKMAALDISAARSGPASPVAKGAPASPVATTPRSSTFSFARSFAERNSALAAESAGTPGAVVSKMPEEHSYTARAASRSRSRSRSVPRSPGHHDTELHQSSETAVAVQFFALDAESVLDEPAHAASPTSSRISAALPEVKRERLGDQEFQMEAEGQEQSLFVDAQMGLEDEPMPPFGSPAALSEAAPPSAATTGEVAATVQTPTTSRSKPTLSEFDPLIAFESPVGGASAAGAPAVAKASTGFSILEMFTGNIGTPTSTFKYSQKDVDGMKATLKAEVRWLRGVPIRHDQDL